eukprot:3936707-Rhodomonas_salina.1
MLVAAKVGAEQLELRGIRQVDLVAAAQHCSMLLRHRPSAQLQPHSVPLAPRVRAAPEKLPERKLHLPVAQARPVPGQKREEDSHVRMGEFCPLAGGVCCKVRDSHLLATDPRWRSEISVADFLQTVE